jgi:sec-independent protein translocase protein TatB
MFGMGFTEILIIAVIAILFLGPDKLPSTMIEIAKFFRSVKNTIGTVKSSLEEEMNVNEIKQEALAYKKKLLDASAQLEKVSDVQGTINSKMAGFGDELLNDEVKTTPKEPKEPQTVTFKKKPKKEDTPDV